MAHAGWKAGTARLAVTPKEPTWMAGYSARTKPSEGAVHDLWVKGLALEDPDGRRALLVTLELCGIDRGFSKRVRDGLEAAHGVKRPYVVLACSHTHSGPVAGTNLLTMYKLDDVQKQRISAYTGMLERAIARVAAEAIGRLESARLSWETGRCDFAVNRRNNKEADVPALRRGLSLKGPVDHDVPVLRLARPDGSLLAVVFGYACHCTVLDFYRFCGDYAGFAQIELEARYPGAQAMFVAGCGGDQNPIPRRQLELAVTYGKQLAASVVSVVDRAGRSVEGPLHASYEEIPLAFAKIPARSQVEEDAKSGNFYVASRARHLLEQIDKDGRLDPVYPYPVQAWHLGGLDWVFLGGEVVVDYALRLRSNLGTSHTWVSAYCNDVMAYIPSLRVLKEGGYEGAEAMIYYGQPSPWSGQVEESIVAAVARAVKSVRPEHPSAAAAPRAAGR
jgi:hypothetical protein